MTDSTAPDVHSTSHRPIQRTREEWSAVLRARGIQPTRSMGQNFLVDPDIVHEIARRSGAAAGDRVVEVGPGMGILTRALLDLGANVLAVELDRDLVRLLRSELGGHERLTLVERDARYVDVDEWVQGDPWRVVANLPYSTGTVIVRHFLEMAAPPTSLTVMLQREVAERMVSVAPDMSLLSLAVQIFAEPEIEFIVPPDVFEPPPKVDSAVITLRMLPTPRISAEARESLFSLATMAFQRKRKTISNGLMMGTGSSRAEIEDLLARAGIDPKLRPQAVDLQSWLRLANEVSE